MTEEKIIKAAIRHLNAEPASSMGRLADAIGVSRATLHRHFAGREELLHALGERALDCWERSQRDAGMEEATASGDPERIAAALRVLLRAFIDDAEEHGFALTDHLINQMPDLVERGDRIEEREIAFYAAAQSAGVLRSDLPPRWISLAVYGLMVAARDGLRRGDVARRDVERLVISTFLQGTGSGLQGTGSGDDRTARP